MTYTYQEVLLESTKYFNGEELSARVFADKYALRDNEGKFLEDSPEKMHRRIAAEFARIEKKKFKTPLTEEYIFTLLDKYQCIIPQGSPLYGIGNKHQYISLSNCYVLDTPEDTYNSILDIDQQLVNISKRRGGVGITLDKLRPKNFRTNNAARTTTGITAWMERYSNSIREVGQNGRRGALMLTLNVHHPDIADFITIKNDLSKVTGANISVQYTDEFLQALENEQDYEQRWPIDNPIFKNRVSAKKIWNLAVENSWKMAEPGVQFIDAVRRESPADCYSDFGFHTTTSNPCSEIYLSPLDSCRLLCINLMYFVKNPFTDEAYFDFELFYEISQIAQRLMDDLVDLELEAIDRILAKIESDPESDEIKRKEKSLWTRIRKTCYDGRRTGTGITALGDVLASCNYKYGTEEANKVVEEIYKVLKFGCYRSSIDIAKEVGPFPIWKYNLEKNNPFLNRIDTESFHWIGPDQKDFYIDGELIYKDMKKYGRANIALLTTAPTGSISTQAGFKINNKWYFGTTSGIEPLFMMSYKRRKKGNPGDKDFRTDFIDQNGDHWMEFKVYHPGVKAWMELNQLEEDASPYFNCSAEEINWINRVKLQAAAQDHIDHSISSTVNLPESINKDKVGEIFLNAWKLGCKGITVYRSGCRTGVLISNETKEKTQKRPKDLNADIHHITVQGIKYVVCVGLENGPYEIFVYRNIDSEGDTVVSKSITSGILRKIKRREYHLISGEKDFNISILPQSPEEEIVCRLISTALRNNSGIEFIVHQMEKTSGDMVNFSKCLCRVLKKYIVDGTKVKGEECPECKGELHRQDGCISCTCGWTKCM